MDRGNSCPYSKKWGRKVVEEYKEMTLTQTAYKVYTAILAERLRKEVKRKAILLPSQTGFRRGMGTLYVWTTFMY